MYNNVSRTDCPSTNCGAWLYLKAVPHDTLYDRLDRERFIYQNGEILCSLHFWAIRGKTGTECCKIASDACSPADYHEVHGIFGFKILCFVNHYVYGKNMTLKCVLS